MCVIIIAEKTFPTKRILTDASNVNPHGSGIAWVEKDGGEDKVFWKKDLNISELLKLSKNTNPPWILHFRVATIGEITTELCQPFAVDSIANPAAEGKAEKVLFHNGTVKNYDFFIFQALNKLQAKIPPGLWNDSRTLAYLVHAYGDNILQFVDGYNARTKQRIALLDSEKKITTFGEWSRGEDLWFSSKIYKGNWGGKWTVTNKHSYLNSDIIDVNSINIDESYIENRGTRLYNPNLDTVINPNQNLLSRYKFF